MKFRKKPVLVDAVQYTPGLEDGYACYVIDGGSRDSRFVGYHDKSTHIPLSFRKVPAIKTLEGFHEISEDDWIITGILGERYPCKAEIFAQTYEAADGPPHEEEAHERIREAYESIVDLAADPFDTYGGFVRGVHHVLEALEIKIEGVNA
ncbi:hypothetical protein MKX34_24160 [Paenibacillus sp. FSL R5-0636]|uniref:hypothetical protein n=1 Tax=Paenibacillus TaxID=44249 RepID=UPI00096EADB3|nr:hypothetical protein [Paenibacillus odorifer]OMC96261.1 hypothetical protein BJP49_11205 [Paenibacillus odorifer]